MQDLCEPCSSLTASFFEHNGPRVCLHTIKELGECLKAERPCPLCANFYSLVGKENMQSMLQTQKWTDSARVLLLRKTSSVISCEIALPDPKVRNEKESGHVDNAASWDIKYKLISGSLPDPLPFNSKLKILKSWLDNCVATHRGCTIDAYERHVHAIQQKPELVTGEIRRYPPITRAVELIKNLIPRFNAPDDHIPRNKIGYQELPLYECTSLFIDPVEDILPEGSDFKRLAFFPKRLIDVNPILGLEHQRLCLGSHCRDSQKYVALSHCWGRNHKKYIPETTKLTLEDRFMGIPTAILPRTFREAIHVCRFIGVRYLWIDSLCIIQDSLEDWEKESAMMGEVYTRAFLTIAASGAADSRDGLFIQHIPPTSIYCVLSLPKESFKVVLGTSFDDHTQSKSNNPGTLVSSAALSQRGWVLQERALSRRIIHFTKQEMVWECRSCVATEQDKKQSYRRNVIEWEDSDSDEDEYSKTEDLAQPIIWGNAADFHLKGATQREDIFALWLRLVEDYTRRSLTKRSDCFPALSGLAHTFKNWTGESKYYAGIWSEDLLNGLLWRTQINSTYFKGYFSKEGDSSESPRYLKIADGIVRRKRGMDPEVLVQHSIPDDTARHAFEWDQHLETSRSELLRTSRAPSWSWASTGAPISYEPRGCYQEFTSGAQWRKMDGLRNGKFKGRETSTTAEDQLMRILDASVVVPGQDPFGAVAAGMITVQGPLISVTHISFVKKDTGQSGIVFEPKERCRNILTVFSIVFSRGGTIEFEIYLDSPMDYESQYKKFWLLCAVRHIKARAEGKIEYATIMLALVSAGRKNVCRRIGIGIFEHGEGSYIDKFFESFNLTIIHIT